MRNLFGQWHSRLFGPEGVLAFLTGATSSRLLPVDALRGFVIVVMALDHANSLIAHGKLEPEMWADVFPNYRGDALAFLTRLVTHPAAPGFFFLMGAGMMLFAASRRQQGWSRGRIIRHFVVRGFLLVLLQFLVENPVWKMGQPPDPTLFFFVLYGLGGTMFLGTLLLYLPTLLLVGLSVLLIVLTGLLLPEARTGFIQYAPLLRLWLLPGYTPGMYAMYPFMPWLGVVGLGIAYGRWLKRDQEQSYRAALWLGVAGLLLFIPIRLLNGFGNIRPRQGDDWIAFLNVVKYPPSVAFLLLTLGVDMLLLGLFARVESVAKVGLQVLAVFGRTPLFFYLTHLYLYAYLGQWLDPKGIGLQRMYPYWLLGLAILFPLCWLYGRFKDSRSPGSVWRFL